MSWHKRNVWRPVLLATLLLIGVLLAGTVFFTRSPLHSPPATVHEATPHQAVSNGSGALGIFDQPQPFLYQNTLYINTGQDIRSYAAQNGAPERTYTLADAGNPTIVSGILYTGGLTSTSAMRISDGKLLWQAPFGSISANVPEIVKGMLYGCTPDKVFYALRTSDGKLLWQYRLGNQNEIPSSPVLVQGSVYFTSYIPLKYSIDARISALNGNDGKLMWHRSLGHVSITQLQTDGSALYFEVDGSVEALRANDGGLLWQYHLPFSSQLEMSNTFLARVTSGIMYVAAGNGTIYALQTADGKPLWRYQASPGTIFSSFSVQGRALYVGMLAVPASNSYRSSSVVALSIGDGHLLWHYQLGTQEVLAPIADQDVIYVTYGTAGQEELYALRAENGVPLWHHTLYALP
jgi:outer membrane protein assembly factor BamB